MRVGVALAAAWAAVAAFLLLCVVLPLSCVAAAPGASDFAAFLSSPARLAAAANTAVSCVCSTALSVAVGYGYAYAVVRGNLPFRRLFAAIPLLHLMTPPFVGGLSFILLFGRQGFVTHRLLGLDVSPYGFWGLVFAQTLCFFPMAYLMCAATLRGIEPNAEQAAFGMGASGARIFRTVTLPLSAPGIASSALFIAVSALSDFGNPMLVGGRFSVLSVEIYTQLTGWLDAGSSAVMGLLLVAPSVALFMAQNRLARKSAERLATTGGRPSGLPPKARSAASRAFLFALCASVTLAVAAQFAAICLGAFQKLWGIRTEFTAEHLAAALSYGKELRNTALFSLAAAALSTLVSMLAAFIVSRTELPFRRTIDVLCQVPAAVPGSLFGLAFSLAAARAGVRSSGVLIVVAISVGFMPFSYRILSATLSQVRTTLDDGAATMGAGKMRTLLEILAPLSARGLFGSFLYDFVRGVGTMSAVIFLVSFGTPLASVRILNLAEEGFWGRAAALALILTAMTFAVLALGRAAMAAILRRTGAAAGGILGAE